MCQKIKAQIQIFFVLSLVTTALTVLFIAIGVQQPLTIAAQAPPHPPPVNEETLALDVIDELGPTGGYLSHDHTLRHFKEPYYSKLADKDTYSRWMERGATTMEERAAQEVDRILETHQPEPLPPDIQRDIKKIVEREQVWIDSR